MQLTDIAGSDVYDQDGRAMMLRAGACSVLSTPLRDDRGRVWGMVSTHHNLPQRLPDDQLGDSFSAALTTRLAGCAGTTPW